MHKQQKDTVRLKNHVLKIQYTSFNISKFQNWKHVITGNFSRDFIHIVYYNIYNI